MSSAPAYSVIIPAHNEAAVIGRCLTAIAHNLPAGQVPPEVIVVCNGCSDDTAQLVRTQFPQVQVIELAQGSKPLALNSGNAAASAPIRIFVDADVIVDGAALAAVAAVLAEGTSILTAAPQIKVDVAHSSAIVRAFYRVWLTTRYIREEMVGSGVYGLSAAGMAQIGTFPPIIADDAFVRAQFATAQRKSVRQDAAGHAAFFTVQPPRDLSSLLRVLARRRVGDLQLRALLGRQDQSKIAQPPAPDALAPAPSHASAGLLDWLCYVAIKLIARVWGHMMFARSGPAVWLRDDSSRAG